MGILNVTPDSFYASSRTLTEKSIIEKAEQMLIEGAKILDIGAFSTRPGAIDISTKDEISRLSGVVKTINAKFPNAIISVDTFRAQVAEVVLNEGAHIINDITAGDGDTNMADVIVKYKATYIIMHMQGTPTTMIKNTNYNNLLTDVIDFFQQKIIILRKKGINDIIIDPGFGFSKTLDQNYEIVKKLDYFNVLNYPMLVGFSRKSMIYKYLDCEPEQALNGTTVLNTLALQKGARILRVHDVKEAMETVAIYRKAEN